MGEKIVCEGERNLQNRKITVSSLNVDGNTVNKDNINKKFENIGCKYAMSLDGSALDCFSI